MRTPNHHALRRVFAKASTRFFAGSAAALLAMTANAQTTGDTPPVSAAHIEDITTFTYKDWLFQHHAKSAHEIISWRMNQITPKPDAKVDLIDSSPYEDFLSKPFLSQYQVISISSTGNSRKILEDRAAFTRAWAQSPAVIIAATGNNTNAMCRDKFKKDSLYEEYVTAFTYGDTVIRTGAIDEKGAMTCYSSENAPDLVYQTAYTQGFCNYYYMTQTEIDAIRNSLPQSVQDSIRLQWRMIGDSFTPHKDAGKLNCSVNGTSFVSPNIAGHVIALRDQFPQATDQDIYVTALLSSSLSGMTAAPGQDAPHLTATFIRNARGLTYSTLAGFGIYNPQAQAAMLQTLKDSNAHIEARAITEQGWTVERDASTGAQTIKVNVNEDGVALRSVLEFRLIPERTERNQLHAQNLPDEITIVSPSGTRITLIPGWEPPGQADPAGMRFAVPTAAFLGENIRGEWQIVLPATAAKHQVKSAGATIWATPRDGALKSLIPAAVPGTNPATGPATAQVTRPAGP